MKDPWEALAAWWLEEVASDPAYETEVMPLLGELLPGLEGTTVLDLGCGEGRIMRMIRSAGGRVVGCDLNESLARAAREGGPVVVARLPSLSFVRAGSFDAVVAVLVLEHLPDLDAMFAEAARVTRLGGCAVVVMNHPLYTAPGSAPIVDPVDGELLWRWGSYLSAGRVTERLGKASIVFHHRPLGEVLTSASRSGWSLERMVERGPSPDTPGTSGVGAARVEVPRLVGFRWLRAPEGEGKPAR